MACEICGKPRPEGKGLDEIVKEGWSVFTIGRPKRHEAAICPDHPPEEVVHTICRDILGWKPIQERKEA